jgi:hypothetical protein
VQVKATLYWSNIDDPFDWEYQGENQSGVDIGEASITYTHSCTRGTRHWWHTLGTGTTVYDGLEVAYKANSRNSLVPCS